MGFSPSRPPAQPPWASAAASHSKRRGCTWPVLGCLIGVGLSAVLAVALVVVIGARLFVDQAKDALRASPVIAEALGELHTIEIEWLDTMNHDGMNTYVFRLEGSRANGKVEAELITIDADTETLGGGVLFLDSGEILDLVPDVDQEAPAADVGASEEKGDHGD